MPPESPKVLGQAAAKVAKVSNSPPLPPKSPRVSASVSNSKVNSPASAFGGGRSSPESKQLPADFQLNYAWQAVPLGVALPGQTEQTLSVDNDMQRLARIPASWSLRVTINEHPASSAGVVSGAASPAAVGIQVEKSLKLGALLARVREHPVMRQRLQGRRLQLLLDGVPLLSREEEEGNQGQALALIEELGAKLFTGTVTARFLGAVIRSNASTPSNASRLHRAAAATISAATNADWRATLSGLGALISRLQNRAAYGELRGCKYGLVGDGDEDYSPFEVQATVKRAMEGDLVGLNNHRVERVCLAAKALLKQHAIGLLPLSAFSESGAIGMAVARGEKLDARKVSHEVGRYHAACGDDRGQVWAALLKHWQWLVHERVLSRDQVGAVFVGAFLRPGERETSDIAAAIRFAIKELTSLNVTVHAQDEENTPRSPSHTSARLERGESYDELLGSTSPGVGSKSSPKNVSREFKRHAADDQEDSEEDSEEEVVVSPTSPIQQARARQMPGMLHQFLAENKPKVDAVEDSGEISDGEFDY